MTLLAVSFLSGICCQIDNDNANGDGGDWELASAAFRLYGLELIESKVSQC